MSIMERGFALEPIQRLTRDLKTAAITLSPDEARFLVDAFYSLQDYRKAAFNQERALETSEEPHDVITWLAGQVETLEKQVGRALDSWTEGNVTGRWSKSIVGVGPVIAAGLLAHINMTECHTVGKIWRFAGLDPSQEWLGRDRAKELIRQVCTDREVTAEQLAVVAARTNRKAEYLRRLAQDEDGRITPASLEGVCAKRPWNADLKVLCWKAGESFVKVQNNPNDTYGHLLAERKVAEWGRNLRGEYADQARDILARKNIGKTTEAYKWYSGGYVVPRGYEYLGARPELAQATNGNGTPMLPPDHIHARAKRWAVKLFLSHWHEAAYFARYGVLPPKPYVFSHLGHSDAITPPNTDLVPGWTAARAAAGL